MKAIAVAKNTAGLLVVTDPGFPTVHFFDLVNQTYRRPEKEDADVIESPVGVAVADDGTVFVSDSSIGEVLVFDQQAELTARFGTDTLQRPSGMVLSSDQESLHVVDTLANEIVTFDREGNRLSAFGSRGDRRQPKGRRNLS